LKTALRWLFAILVLANLGVVMWASWYREPVVPPSPSPLPPLHPEKMVPLSVPGLVLKPLPQAVNARASKSAPLAPVKTETPPPPPHQCLTIGPFDTDAAAQNAGASLHAGGIVYSLRTQDDRVVSSYWVFLPPRASHRQAELTLRQLDRKGIREHVIVQEPGMDDAISLGLYTQPENARARIAELVKKGVHAKLQTRYRTRTRYWLDVEIVEPGQHAHLKSQHWDAAGVAAQDMACTATPGPSVTPANGAPASSASAPVTLTPSADK